MLPSSRKLNIFQRGILQKCFTFFVYTICLISASLFLDCLDKRWFLKSVNIAVDKGEIPEKTAQAFAILIQSRDELFFLFLIFFGAACGLAGFLLVRLAAKFQWSWPITLPKAVEFRQAMEKIGITDPDDRIDFARKHGLPAYIASKPFLEMEHDNVKARFYAFADSLSIGNREIFNTYTGNQRLCLDGDDFSVIQEKFGQKAQGALAARVATLEDGITSLKSEVSLKQAEIDYLKNENLKLAEENESCKNKIRTFAGRERKIDKRSTNKIPFRRVAYPLVNRLIAHAMPEEKYTRKQIQDEFMRELSGYPEMEDSIRQLLHTQKKEADNTPFDLDGWAMEEIRNALGEYVQTEPGRKK